MGRGQPEREGRKVPGRRGRKGLESGGKGRGGKKGGGERGGGVEGRERGRTSDEVVKQGRRAALDEAVREDLGEPEPSSVVVVVVCGER